MFIPLFILTIISSSCIKTAEQLQKEKRLESISDQVGDTQGLMANLVEQMKDIQVQINKLNGRLDELEHKQSQLNTSDISNIKESLELVKNQQELSSNQFSQIQNDLQEQKTYIEKVTDLLSSKNENSPSGTKSKKKTAKDDLEFGLNLVKKNQYTDARKQLEPLIDHPDLTPGEKNKVLHGLGRVEFYSGQHEKAMVYFSKIFTKFPKSSLAPGSLLFIGKSLNKMGKKDEAREAFEKVLEDYKGTKEADDARKELQ